MSTATQEDIFFIVGAQKCGTTAIWQYLGHHSNICAPKIKESHFFSCDKQYEKGLAYYLDLLGRVGVNKLRFDASPSYLNSEKAHRRIYEFNPNAKIILALRNPVERAFSAWNMYSHRYKENKNWFFDEWLNTCSHNTHLYERRNRESLFCFERYVQEEIDFLSKENGKSIEAPILPQGQYFRQIQNLLRIFEREKILIIENSELRFNTLSTLKKMEYFLEVPENDWSNIDLSGVFEGLYFETIPTHTKTLLGNFYADQNDRLSRFLKRDFMWS